MGIVLLSLLSLGWAAEKDRNVSEGSFDPAVAAKALNSGALTNSRGESLFPTPVLVITPATLDFGPVLTNTTATNTFLVENAGRGKVAGKATVSPPFKVIDGGSYSLTRKEKQLVTVVYAPRAYTGSNDVRSISFTGAGTAEATVMGRPVRTRPTAASPGR